MKYRWSFAQPQTELCAQLSGNLGVSPLLAQCLVNRGLCEVDPIRLFLEPRLKQLTDPFLIPNMGKAVDRLLAAREKGESLVIFGDYDVDGVTSTALLVDILKRLGWKAFHYLPHRREEGYGLSGDGVHNCLEKYPVKLLLAVDCGSTAVEVVDELGKSGVEVIVLDHHQISTPAPQVVALVNPHAERDAKPYSELCSAGLSFKLAHALVKRLRKANVEAASELDLREFLDLVALGTIADLVPLTGENRILASSGLERLQGTRRPGLVALKKVAQCPVTLGSHEVGFQLAPRLNASGRLENAGESLHLLLAEDLEEAEQVAIALDDCNRERQSIERAIAEDVIQSVRARFDPKSDFVIVEGNASWHVGVVGIVASRVLSKFHRPTIILGGDNGVWRGSGRSIVGFDMAAALRQCSDLLLRHGGHALAAGLSIEPDKVDLLRGRLNDMARGVLTPELLQPSLSLDAQVVLSDVTAERVRELARLNPTGQGNGPVRVAVCGLSQQQPMVRLGKERQHVKMRVTDGRCSMEAMWWNWGEGQLPTSRFDLACVPQINSFAGRQTVQLRVLDWRG